MINSVIAAPNDMAGKPRLPGYVIVGFYFVPHLIAGKVLTRVARLVMDQNGGKENF